MNETTQYATCCKCGARLTSPSTNVWRRCLECHEAGDRDHFKEVTRWNPDRIVQLLPCTGHVVFYRPWPKATREEYFSCGAHAVLAWGLRADGIVVPLVLVDWPAYVEAAEGQHLVIHETEVETIKDKIWEWASEAK